MKAKNKKKNQQQQKLTNIQSREEKNVTKQASLKNVLLSPKRICLKDKVIRWETFTKQECNLFLQLVLVKEPDKTVSKC